MSVSRRRTYRVLAVLIPCLVLAAVGWQYYESTLPVVPDVVGLDRSRAEELLDQEGIDGEVHRYESDKRLVCEQRPDAGERASDVVLFVDCPVGDPSLPPQETWVGWIPIFIGLLFIFGGCGAVIMWANRRGLKPGFWPHAVLTVPVIAAGVAIMVVLEPLIG